MRFLFPITSWSTIFDQYPEIKESLKTVLVNLREILLPVSSVSACNLAIGFMKSKKSRDSYISQISMCSPRCGTSNFLISYSPTCVLYNELRWIIYEMIGAKQVRLHAWDEKRAFTAVLGAASTCCVLATQSVWKGKTSDSRPSLKSSKAAIQEGHRFVSYPRKDWSSFDTSKGVGDRYSYPLPGRISVFL